MLVPNNRTSVVPSIGAPTGIPPTAQVPNARDVAAMRPPTILVGHQGTRRYRGRPCPASPGRVAP